MPGVVLSAGDELRNLLGRYCDLMDAADWAGVGALFASGQLATSDGTVLARGAEEVSAFYRRGTRVDAAGSPRTKHLVANSQVTVSASASADGASAEVRSSYLVLQDLVPIITGRYVDTFTVVGGAWTWQERRFTVDYVGDLSNHLTYELP